MLNNTTTSAMTFAVKLLGLRNHSREELKRKLLRKGYAPEKIEPVLDKLTAQGVLDDMIFSIELIKSRSRRKPSGKLKIHAELRQRGVAETIIEELLNEYESTELCYRAAEKKSVHCMGQPISIEKRSLRFSCVTEDLDGLRFKSYSSVFFSLVQTTWITFKRAPHAQTSQSFRLAAVW